jgi:hypothetical protein
MTQFSRGFVIALTALLAGSGCATRVPTDTSQSECTFSTKLLPVSQMHSTDVLEFSGPSTASLVKIFAFADDPVNDAWDFGEVSFIISDSSNAQIVVAKTEGVAKDWVVDKAVKLPPGRYKMKMLVSNEKERVFRVRVDAC